MNKTQALNPAHLGLKGQHRTALALQLLAPVCCLEVKLIQRLDAQQLVLTLCVAVCV
jgi:hypothetical protein